MGGGNRIEDAGNVATTSLLLWLEEVDKEINKEKNL